MIISIAFPAHALRKQQEIKTVVFHKSLLQYQYTKPVNQL